MKQKKRSDAKPPLDLSAPLRVDQREELLHRLAARTSETESCWLFEGAKGNRFGHRRLTYGDRPEWVHRIAYAVHVGPIREGMKVCHTCDVPNCVLPEHLFLGTQAENAADMRRKGRGVKPPTHSGESHPMVSLSDGQVAEIRELRRRGVKQRDVAKQFGCSQSTVWRIAHGVVRSSP